MSSKKAPVNNASSAVSAKDAPELWIPELTDSVDAQFGGEYSEETMNMVKGYPKPTWMDEPSVSDMQEPCFCIICPYPQGSHA